MKLSMKLFWNGLKLAGCGAIIASVAFAFAVYYPDGSVGQAEADIFWLGPASLQDSKQKQFVDFLDDQGFSDPQPYSYNGNTLYFSHSQTTDSPGNASRQLQRALVESGINQHTYPRPPDPTVVQDVDPNSADLSQEQREQVAYSAMGATDFFSGGLVPVIDTPDHITMTGVELLTQEKGATDLADILVSIWGAEIEHPSTLFNNFRTIEIFQPQGSSTTQQIAIFGDGDVDFNSFAPGGGLYDRVAPQLNDVPPCSGCERNTEFAGLESQSDYAMTTYNTRESVADVLRFYDRAMPMRGWQASTGLQLVQAMRSNAPRSYDAPDQYADMRTFARGNSTVHIHVEPASGPGTLVNIFSQ